MNGRIGHSAPRPEMLDLLDAYLKATAHDAKEINRQRFLFRMQQIRSAITDILSKAELAESQRQLLGQRLTVLFMDSHLDMAF